MTKLYKTLAVLALLVVLFCFYQWWSSGLALNKSLEHNRVLSGVERFVFWRGQNAFRDLLAEKSKDSDLLFFDGHQRWAYVQKSRHELGRGCRGR